MFRATHVLSYAVVLGVAAGSQAALVQLNISGSFGGTNALIINNPLPGVIAPTTTYNASIVYDTSATGVPSGSDFNYSSAIQSMSVTFHTTSGDVPVSADITTGTVPLVFPLPTGGFVTPNPPSDTSSGDQLQFAAGISGANSPSGHTLYMIVQFFTPNGDHPLGGSGALPSTLSPDFLLGSSTATLPSRIQIYPDFSNIGQASILSASATLVPAPGSLCLVPLTLAAAARRRRR